MDQGQPFRAGVKFFEDSLVNAVLERTGVRSSHVLRAVLNQGALVRIRGSYLKSRIYGRRTLHFQVLKQCPDCWYPLGRLDCEADDQIPDRTAPAR